MNCATLIVVYKFLLITSGLANLGGRGGGGAVYITKRDVHNNTIGTFPVQL